MTAGSRAGSLTTGTGAGSVAAGPGADLASRQAALLAALVAGGPLPAGFDAAAVGVAALALRRKRAGEVARAWPAVAAALGPEWGERFTHWAVGRTPRGSLLDGWAFTTDLLAAVEGTATSTGRGQLDGVRLSAEPLAGVRRALAEVEVVWSIRDEAAVRRRRPAVRRVAGGLVFQVRGRVHRLTWSRRNQPFD